MQYFEVITNAQTGEQIIRPYTEEEIIAAQAEAAKAAVPASITPRQCRLILLQQGLLASVEAMILEQGEAARVTWEYALEFRRDDPLLIAIAENMTPPLTPEQIDQFFIAASQL